MAVGFETKLSTTMTANQLILKQRAELLAVLCGGASAEPLECVLDLLLAWEILVWEDYLSIRVTEKPLCSNVRQLLDVMYDKGEDACSLFLTAMNQVLSEEQKAGLCFGKECAVVGENRPDTATLTLLADRPVLVRKLRDNIDGALNALLTTGCFTIKDCDAVQLPVYTPSQQVKTTLIHMFFLFVLWWNPWKFVCPMTIRDVISPWLFLGTDCWIADKFSNNCQMKFVTLWYIYIQIYIFICLIQTLKMKLFFSSIY